MISEPLLSLERQMIANIIRMKRRRRHPKADLKLINKRLMTYMGILQESYYRDYPIESN